MHAHAHPRPRLVSILVIAIGCLLAAADPAEAQDRPHRAVRAVIDAWTTPPSGASAARTPSGGRGRLTQRPRTPGWSVGLRAALLHQLEAGIDGGGRVAVNRAITSTNVRYGLESGIPLTLSLGYRFDGYDFDGRRSGAFPARPWGDVHGVSVGAPLFVPLGPRWFVLGVAALRTTVEAGAAADEGITGGGFAGASYKLSEDLRIGPGLGVFTQIEDDPSVFPVLLVDWQVRPDLSLKTGRGLGATQGPGLFLEWRPDGRWTVSLGGRFDRLRFRLDDDGVAPRGVGEESALAVVLAARFEAGPRIAWSASVGATFLGELRVEDRRGHLVAREDYDTAVFFGLGLSITL